MNNETDIICPKRFGREIVNVFIIATIVIFGLTTIGVIYHLMKKADAVIDTVTLDSLWFERQLGSIRTASVEIQVAQEALDRKVLQMSDRWMSRESDRVEFDRLNNLIASLKVKRAELISSYNANLKIVPVEVSVGHTPIVE